MFNKFFLLFIAGILIPNFGYTVDELDYSYNDITHKMMEYTYISDQLVDWRCRGNNASGYKSSNYVSCFKADDNPIIGYGVLGTVGGIVAVGIVNHEDNDDVICTNSKNIEISCTNHSSSNNDSEHDDGSTPGHNAPDPNVGTR